MHDDCRRRSKGTCVRAKPRETRAVGGGPVTDSCWLSWLGTREGQLNFCCRRTNVHLSSSDLAGCEAEAEQPGQALRESLTTPKCDTNCCMTRAAAVGAISRIWAAMSCTSGCCGLLGFLEAVWVAQVAKQIAALMRW